MMTKEHLLKFGENNAKLFGIYTFSLPSGWTCPGANICLAKAIRKGKRTKLVRGKNSKFTCYQATLESIFPGLYEAVHHNLNLLKAARTAKKMAELIHYSLPFPCRIVRIHVGGDYYNQAYLMAWIIVAKNNPNILFYSYTKSIKIWKKLKHLIPANLILTASLGGKFDDEITREMKLCEVVYSPEEALLKGIPIDHDDSHAYSPSVNHFATLLHGKQAAGSEAAQALKDLKKRGLGVYNSKVKGRTGSRPEFNPNILKAAA